MLRRIVRRTIPAAVLLLAFGTIPPAFSATKPLEITVVLPLTGQAAQLGLSAVKALTVVQNDVNAAGGIGGEPVHFNMMDDHSDPALSVQITNQVISEKAAVMLGPSFGASCQAVVPLLKNGPVSFCFSPGVHPDPGSYIFAAAPSTGDLATVTARYAKRRGWKRIAFLFTTDQSGMDGEKQLGHAFAQPDAAGVKVVGIEHFAPGDLSVVAQVSRLKATAPDALYVWATGTPSTTALRAIQEVGVNVPIITSYSNSTASQMATFKDYMPKELLMPGPPAMLPPDQLPRGAIRDADAKFYRAMQAAGAHPDVMQVTAWDSAQIALAALRKLGPNATAAQVRDYVADLKGFTGITGTFDFRALPQRGANWTSVLMAKWDPHKNSFVAAGPIGG